MEECSVLVSSFMLHAKFHHLKNSSCQRVDTIKFELNPELVDWAISNCDGLLCPGGRFAFLPEHYAYGLTPRSPTKGNPT